MRSSLVSVYAPVFYLLKNEWNFEENWLAEDDMMKIYNDINLRKFSACKKWNSFRSNIGKKEGTSANNTVTLTEKNGLICIFIIGWYPYMNTLSSSLDMSFLSGGIYFFKTYLARSIIFLNLVFWERLKERTFDIIGSAMAIVRRVLLEVIGFWEWP